MLPFTNYLLLAFKFFFVLGAVLYFIFSIVIVKQTTTMSQNVSDKFNPFLIAFSYLHLLFAFSLIILTLIIL
jgi:hypothetical protein